MGSRSSGLVLFGMRVVSGLGLVDLVGVVVFGLSMEEIGRGGVTGIVLGVGIGRVFTVGILSRGIIGRVFTVGILSRGIIGGGNIGVGGGGRFCGEGGGVKTTGVVENCHG